MEKSSALGCDGSRAPGLAEDSRTVSSFLTEKRRRELWWRPGCQRDLVGLRSHESSRKNY